ncbi:MAG TPA: NAD-dependent epimerase/dehydratase family protein [Mycobacteriales bacterium]|jgi:2'-hydroxyisoflavone reductase|nr:NAD-dependent epimerase/dehydratase family protein [Mycobacteriales bacterium]
MDLLVIGGTVFVGRAIVTEALRRGHTVTVFHRGQHGEDAHPGVEHLHGDRATDLAVLDGRRWDAVVDTCGFDAGTVGASARHLAGSVGHYGFVSSVSVYADWPAVAVDESGRVKAMGDEDAYGAGKVAAETAAEAALPGRVLVSRPGLIAGPYENIGRLPYWLRRVALGGEVLAPGEPDEPRQWIDARDLAAFHLDAAERGLTGVFNTVGPPAQFTMGELLETCRDVTGSDATFTWVDGKTVTEHGYAPWTELPVWLWDAEADVSATWQVDVSKAVAAGLAARPVRETVADTWDWVRAGADLGGYRSSYAVPPYDAEKERAVLAAAR